MKSGMMGLLVVRDFLSSRENVRKGIRRLIKGKTKKPPKLGDMSHIAFTQLDQSASDVAVLLREDGARRVLVNADRALFEAMKAELPDVEFVWCSLYASDVALGAIGAAQADEASFDAIVAGGPDAAVRFRFSVRQAQRKKPDLPVHWVAQKFVFCKGVVSAPAESEEVEALVFNHFERYFAIKDPLMFRIEIYHGDEMKRLWRILKPNESVVVKVTDHFPRIEKPVAISTMVTHPYLTSGRHIRFRVCADVHWKGSFTTLHSAHEFRRDPADLVETRVATHRVRSGAGVITVPNYERNVVANAVLGASSGAAQFVRPRDPALWVDEVRVELPPGKTGAPFFDCHYNGYGGSFWFALEESNPAAGLKARGSIAGNHHVQNPRRDLSNYGISDQERARFEELRKQGFALEPHPVPVTHGKGLLRWGFDCDTSNPPFWNFLLYWFDGSGKLIGAMPYHKAEMGTVFADDLVKQFDHPRAKEAALLCFTPDWTKDHIQRKGFRLLADLVVEHVETGDRDVTEFQSAWRNLGTIIPDFPHWLTPAMGAIGRTNLFARARTGGGYRSAVLAINASGRLDYDTPADAEVVVYNLAGEERRGKLHIKPFSWSLEWLDTLIPGLEAHLGPGGIGALMLVSPDADLCAQVVSTNANKAVALQHLWGY